jgi:hypothetical protein
MSNTTKTKDAPSASIEQKILAFMKRIDERYAQIEDKQLGTDKRFNN